MVFQQKTIVILFELTFGQKQRTKRNRWISVGLAAERFFRRGQVIYPEVPILALSGSNFNPKIICPSMSWNLTYLDLTRHVFQFFLFICFQWTLLPLILWVLSNVCFGVGCCQFWFHKHNLSPFQCAPHSEEPSDWDPRFGEEVQPNHTVSAIL